MEIPHTKHMKKYFIFFVLALNLIFSDNKQQIAYLMRSKELNRSLELYEKYRQAEGKHDFELLQQLASIILEGGMHGDEEEKLLSIFGLGLAGISSSGDILNVLERGLRSHTLQTQLYCIQFLGQLQDDRSEALLAKAMASDFLLIRLEAAQQLSLRKERSALGQIEALMHKLPPLLSRLFP